MTFKVELQSCFSTDSFHYETLDLALEGAVRLAKHSLEIYEEDGIQRTIAVQCWPLEPWEVEDNNVT